MIITLPYQFELRDYQRPFWKAMFVDKKRKFICVWHRRAGKTKLVTNIILAQAYLRVGGYYHYFPTRQQAEDVWWKGRGEDGLLFIDHFPPSLIKKINVAKLFIEFNNGSTFQLRGSDIHGERARGGGPVGVIYDEYSYQNPYGADPLLPALIANKGFEIFIFTPNGTNHAHQLLKKVQNNPNWFTEILTIDQTYKEDGSRIITQDDLQDQRDRGKSEDFLQQEYYCSFTAAVKGAYFGPQLARVEKDNRIYDFPIRTDVPVDTYWDLGALDATAIWFAQERHEGIFAINYYENHLMDMNHYIHKLQEFQAAHNIVYRHHFAPHDGAHKRLSLDGNKSLVQQCRELGLNFIVLPRINKKSRAIEQGRQLFNRVTFHKTNCKRGLDCLREYHAHYNEAMQYFSPEPEHNWASHGADAYLYMAQAILQESRHTVGAQRERSVFTSSIFD